MPGGMGGMGGGGGGEAPDTEKLYETLEVCSPILLYYYCQLCRLLN